MILRYTSPSLDDPLVREVVYDGIEWYQVNRSYLKKYFSPTDPLIPELKPSLFKKTKDENLFRIVCLGGSSMFGTPYQMTATIPGMVRKQLRHLYRKKEIEVVNLAASAINSNVIADFAPRLVEFDPDLVLIYMGHNEFYGPDGVGAAGLEKVFPFITPMKYRFRELRSVAMIRGMFKSENRIGEEHTLMKQVSEDSRVPLESDDARRVFELYETNLGKILSVFREKAISVVVSDVTSNLMFPPFAGEGSNSGSNLSAASLYRQGREAMRGGRFEKAKEFLLQAKDNDLLKFRAPERTNEITKRVCAESNVSFISSDSLFSSKSPSGIPGSDLFWEHLHPNAYGYYLIANLFVEKIVELKLLDTSPPYLSTLPFNYDSLSICLLDLAYGDVSIKNLTSKWPFQDYVVKQIVMPSADEDLRKTVSDVFARAVTWDEGSYQSASNFQRRGSFREAETTYEAILEEYPYNFYAHALLGNLLMQRGELHQAIHHLERSIKSDPGFVPSRLDLGLVLINLGKFDQAISELEAALSLSSAGQPADTRANIYYGLAGAYANKREFDKALRYLDESLKLVPNYPSALTLRSAILSSPR